MLLVCAACGHNAVGLRQKSFFSVFSSKSLFLAIFCQNHYFLAFSRQLCCWPASLSFRKRDDNDFYSLKRIGTCWKNVLKKKNFPILIRLIWITIQIRDLLKICVMTYIIRDAWSLIWDHLTFSFVLLWNGLHRYLSYCYNMGSHIQFVSHTHLNLL